jgi:hypothetical protein
MKHEITPTQPGRYLVTRCHMISGGAGPTTYEIYRGMLRVPKAGISKAHIDLNDKHFEHVATIQTAPNVSWVDEYQFALANSTPEYPAFEWQHYKDEAAWRNYITSKYGH